MAAQTGTIAGIRAATKATCSSRGNNGHMPVLGLDISVQKRHRALSRFQAFLPNQRWRPRSFSKMGGREGVSRTANNAREQGSEFTHLLLTFCTSHGIAGYPIHDTGSMRGWRRLPTLFPSFFCAVGDVPRAPLPFSSFLSWIGNDPGTRRLRGQPTLYTRSSLWPSKSLLPHGLPDRDVRY